MSVTTLPTEDVFRTTALRGLPESADVDRKNRVIRGAKAMQFGRLNEGDARPWKVDQTTLEQLRDAVNQSNNGVKMRFSHPNMSRDGMGRHLGRARNARIVGEGADAYVAVDAHLSDAANRTPHGNLAEHVLDLAEESPDQFGLSIAPVLDMEAMQAAVQQEKKDRVDDGYEPIRMSKLRAIDFVDEPAATRGGLFSLDSDSLADLPAQASWLLDTFFADATPEVIRGRFDEFLKTYLTSRGDNLMTTSTNGPTAADLEAKQAEIDALTKKVADLEAKVESPPADEAKKAEAKAELQRRSEISALCQLANVSDKDRDLMLDAGMSRAEVHEHLKSRLSAVNAPVSETSTQGEPKTDDDKLGAEWDQFSEVYGRMGLTREQYIASRKRDN